MFAIGFALGTFRTVVIAPAIGETLAVLAELPVMLTLSWVVAKRLTANRADLNTAYTRLIMGGSAFALLIAAEFILARFGFGRSLTAQLATYLTLSGAMGLAAQIAFGLFPRIQLALYDT
ncbi:hypothetical protein [Falsiphaeobacter marinintestinus]|uniref:hypothetical protein n=1 Tax=Falsiphaeobacter marinintestinus TaxID=1492905 RepID=UPI0011B574C2|nr:hypothetical protein [Phaeobacter marinintestinus]